MKFILIILIGVVAIAFAIYAYYTAKERREAMAKVATQLGLDYEPKDLWGKDAIYSSISLFNKGDSHKAYNIISGNKEETYVDIFDYQYSTGSGKNRTTHSVSACILKISQQFKTLYIRPENFLDKIAGAIGFDDIDFESKEFSSRFYVKSNDKKFAYDIIHPQMMEFLMKLNHTPRIEMTGPYCAFYHESKIDPDAYIGLYNFAREFYNKTPNYVLEEYKT
jgi:hypothetical protein